LSHADHQIGRFVAFLEKIGKLKSTLIFVCSDNGASAEGTLIVLFDEMSFFNIVPETVEENIKRIDEIGGPTCYNHYPVGWAMAGETPFKWYKQYTDNGGVKAPFIVHWESGIRRLVSIHQRPIYCYNYLTKRTYIRSTKEIPTGKKVTVRYQFYKTGQEKLGAGGYWQVVHKQKKIGEGQIQQTVKAHYSLDEFWARFRFSSK